MWFFKKKEKIKLAQRSLVSIRMEAVGGQGANSAGKILAEAGVIGMGYTGNHFSSFGSEKRGSPVRSFVRFSPEKKPVRSASFIAHPNLLMVFHESMLSHHIGCLEGVGPDTDLLVNSANRPYELKLPRGVELRNLITVDAGRIAREHHCGLNAVILGASLSVLPEVEEEALLSSLERFFERLPSDKLKANLKGFKAGVKAAKVSSFENQQATLEIPHGALPRQGWQNAPIGALILGPGNTVLKDNSTSRNGVAPRLLTDVCFNCGFCDMVCPDYCFVWEKAPNEGDAPTLKGIDYQFCKGCQKCIAICPVNALVPTKEAEIPVEDKNHRLFPMADPEKIEARWKGATWDQVVKDLAPDGRTIPLQKDLLDQSSYIKPDFSQTSLPGLKSKPKPKK